MRTQRGSGRPLIVGVSGSYKQGADKLLSQMLGMDHYFLKPYDPAALTRLLASYAASRPPVTSFRTAPQSPRPPAR